MWVHNSKNIGEFETVDHVHFTYRPTTDPWAVKHGLTHEIDMFRGTRFAIVKKTVVHVAVDESQEGTPVLETWKLRSNNVYYH